MGMLMPIALFIVVFYFILYRPQKKKQEAHDKMTNAITRGDTIITIGGFYGVVRDVLDDSFIIEIDEGVKVRLSKAAVNSRLEGGTKLEGMRVRKKKKRRRPEVGLPERNAAAEGVSAEENEALLEQAPAVEPEVPAEQTQPADGETEDKH